MPLLYVFSFLIKSKINKYFSIGHWNLNSLTAHNYLKVSQLQAFNLVHKFDIICILKTHLDSSISKDNNALLDTLKDTL